MKTIDKESASKAAAAWEAKKVGGYFTELKQEFKRVEWTSKDELRFYTKLVLASTFLVGMSVYFVDLAIQGVLWGVQNLLRFITG